ncbi:DNA-directed RNA polymerase subunit beta [Rossellomorea sp. KS-H15a]|uniref:DNA-directed RNA polymerase subunit beta n=1 Tax=Rossellomorea sp. KS-H15a TaxID=2963940 RepID=UPI0020C69C05|nr:DNA-directed RNA polymerase subunit beta [Rossellomorea sp. KS-H15a]UTE77543.1 DNA-directed RNA polymerase subunit beta [Rossellomorea sp. KS-H15a]
MSEKELLQEKVTRESVKTENKAKQKDETRPSRWVRVRMLPIWLRILLFILLLAGSLVLGAVIGFAGIGNGNAADVFKAETWQHIIDIVVKK